MQLARELVSSPDKVVPIPCFMNRMRHHGAILRFVDMVLANAHHAVDWAATVALDCKAGLAAELDRRFLAARSRILYTGLRSLILCAALTAVKPHISLVQHASVDTTNGPRTGTSRERLDRCPTAPRLPFQ